MPFAGNVIPAFKSCVRTVTELHEKVPYARCIGWDVPVDREENLRLLDGMPGTTVIHFLKPRKDLVLPI